MEAAKLKIKIKKFKSFFYGRAIKKVFFAASLTFFRTVTFDKLPILVDAGFFPNIKIIFFQVKIRSDQIWEAGQRI